jgi:hypothetical protein
MLLGFALLGLTEAPRHALDRLALARAAWRVDRREQGPVEAAQRSAHARLGELPAALLRGGRSFSREVAHLAGWLIGR